jgi:hypothetical protein
MYLTGIGCVIREEYRDNEQLHGTLRNHTRILEIPSVRELAEEDEPSQHSADTQQGRRVVSGDCRLVTGEW